MNRVMPESGPGIRHTKRIAGVLGAGELTMEKRFVNNAKRR